MNIPETIYFFVNGVENWPGNSKNWNKRAVTWIHLNTPHRAQADEYFTTPLTVWMHQKERARVFADLIKKFAGWNIIIVAHSNGARIAIDALQMLHWPRVEALHLVCGACDANFARTGLNHALRTGKLGHVFVYVAERDFAMRAEDTFTGHALFGLYGQSRPLGLRGPENVVDGFMNSTSPGLDRVVEMRWPGYGHSTCWDPRNFDKTMRHFVQDGAVSRA